MDFVALFSVPAVLSLSVTLILLLLTAILLQNQRQEWAMAPLPVLLWVSAFWKDCLVVFRSKELVVWIPVLASRLSMQFAPQILAWGKQQSLVSNSGVCWHRQRRVLLPKCLSCCVRLHLFSLRTTGHLFLTCCLRPEWIYYLQLYLLCWYCWVFRSLFCLPISETHQIWIWPEEPTFLWEWQEKWQEKFSQGATTGINSL
mmetsp:Transcript_10252/g.25747  ORF Transcript_10252/g.25747 Transcript_10252/m.25747 type:complete len:201 (+) Transcript_10252:2230-2832(+)